MIALAGFGAQALARRGVSGTEKRAIMTAAGVRTKAPLRCYRFEVSTVGPSSAATTYGGAFTKPRLTYAADGVSVTHFVRGQWRFVSAGSAFNCPMPGHIPAAGSARPAVVLPPGLSATRPAQATPPLGCEP